MERLATGKDTPQNLCSVYLEDARCLLLHCINLHFIWIKGLYNLFNYAIFWQEFHCRPSNNTIFMASLQQCGGMFPQRIQLKSIDSQWSPMGPCHFNCITPGRGLRVLKRRLEHNIQLCDPDKVKQCLRNYRGYEFYKSSLLNTLLIIFFIGMWEKKNLVWIR